MKETLKPLSFLKIGDELEGRFPLFCSPPQVVKDESKDTEGIVVWPPESSILVDAGGEGAKIARGLWN